MRLLDALQAPFRQAVEVVERSSSVTVHSGAVDEIDPPEDLDELHYDVYESVGIVAASIDQYVSDVFEPGVRVEADSDETAAFINDEFLPNCGVVGGETHQPFDDFAPVTETQKLTRGTVLVNLLPNDNETPIPETEVTGFYHIPPETVTPLVYENKNILIAPEDTDHSGVTLTARDEAAAYAQFEDESILGRRRNGFDRDTVWLSQNDVKKYVNSVDIGGDGSDETGIWGRSALRPIKEEAEEYERIKRDRATAIRTKAYGIWWANFLKEVHELPNNKAEIQEWDDPDIDAVMSELESMEPGDVIEVDGPLELDQWESDVPDLDDTLRQLVDDILAPLPAPKYAVGFETDINQFVVDGQEKRYEEVVSDGRREQEAFWTPIFATVAESHDRDPAGLQVHIEPEKDESPILSLTDEEIGRMQAWAEAFAKIRGDVPADMVADQQQLLELILQLPEEAAADVKDIDLDESDPEVQAQASALADALGEQEAD